MSKQTQLKDYFKEIKLFNNRSVVVLILSVSLISLLLMRMYYLQVEQHEHFTTLSKNNRVRIQAIPPTRGLIYDKNGIVLAENIPSFTLEVTPEKVKSIDEVLEKLTSLIEIKETDLKRFKKAFKNKHRFESIPLRFNLTSKEVAIFASNRHKIPGVEVEAQLSRHYPFGKETAHIVGYVGRINPKELKQLSSTDELANYKGTHYIGKLGIEKSYEKDLHGQAGFQQVETNVRGRVLRVLKRTDPIPGNDLYLNIDIKLQQIAMKAFTEQKGALVAINPKNGQVITMVSMPTYDANLFVNGISHKDFNELNSSIDRPLFNRSILGQYPPGSTSKPFLALAGLEVATVSAEDKVYCPGFYQLKDNDHKYRDWKKRGHGLTDINKAIVQSCDVYFYDLAYHLGIDKMSRFMNLFGFGEKVGIDVPGERKGLMPSREWKRKVKGQAWFPGETLITGIGQGYMLATPLQLSSATASLANNGIRYKPQLVNAINYVESILIEPSNETENDALKQDKSDSIKNSIDKDSSDISLKNKHSKTKVLMKPDWVTDIPIRKQVNWDQIRESMKAVVHSSRGTARRLNKPGMNYFIAGKTGTAQVFTVAQDDEYDEKGLAKTLKDHALFVAYAPIEDPTIAIGIIVENGGHGGSVAAPIAGKVIEHYLSEKVKSE